MKLFATQLFKYSLSAKDGEIGNVTDVYFDDSNWNVRYFVVETGSWLFKRKVLISAFAIEGTIETENELLPVSLTKDQVKDSPDIDIDMPVSLQQESSLFKHYSWPSFGRAGTGWPTTGMVKATSALINKAELENDFDPHLRSFKHVSQYEVHNEAGRIGLVKDLIIDHSNWSIPFLLIDDVLTSDKERVVIAITDIISIDWDTFQVNVSLTHDDIKSAALINAEGFFSKDKGGFRSYL
jgi:uncharacterized protein YrrD